MTNLVITCPECGTSYKADRDAIGPNGRTVRCANCGETWFVPAPDTLTRETADAIALRDDLTQTDPELVPDSLSETASTLSPDSDASAPSNGVAPREFVAAPAAVGADVLLRDQADAQRLKRRKRTIRIIWIVTALIAIAAIVTAYLNRQEIVNRQPQMASVYQAFGIDVRAGGLTLDPPIAKTALVEGRPIIRVEGTVRNLSRDAVAVPLIELSLHDPNGAELVQWFVEPSQNRLSARGRLPFVTEYADPPSDVTSLRYRFVAP